jgi:L-ectoine synthase
MIVRTLHEVRATEREVSATSWTSRRLLLAGDGTSFSLHDTVLRAGTSTEMCYRNHVEAVYCIDGLGRLVDLDHEQVHAIEPGTLYVLDEHERHCLIADTDLRVVCVFDPPLVGREVHDETGSYPLLGREGTAS